ncbi:hypothetical protein B0H11DRAFT_2110319 [Mycena galericulata]|nr:hypothetical protein B0H11DRAFT_2110319 [Mycena galericulata]
MSLALGPASSLAPFPPEVLLRMLSFVKDNDSFKDIVKVSRQFYALGTEERARNMYWTYAEDVEPRLVQWAQNSRRHRTKELNISLKLSYDYNFILQQKIFASLHIFPNLTSLTIRGGRITGHIHTAVTHLPSLRRLRLQWCAIYAVDRTAAPPAQPFTVTSLVLHDIHVFDRTGEELDILDAAALQQRNLSLMPLALLNGLTALEIFSDLSSARVLRQAYCFLRDTPLLAELRVEGPPPSSSPYEDDPLGLGPGPSPSPSPPLPPALALPLVHTFRGPHCIAASLMASAAHIAEVVLTDEMTPSQALIIVKSLHPGAVRNVELTLERWDEEVACEIGSRFVQCKRIKIVHRYGGPSEEWLFDFGIRRLPPTLNTLLIHARPQNAVRQEPRPHFFDDSDDDSDYFAEEWDDEGAAGLRDVPPPPGEEDVREAFAVWKRYMPYLEVVAVGGHLWTKDFGGSVWQAGEESA